MRSTGSNRSHNALDCAPSGVQQQKVNAMSGYIETHRTVVYPWHCDHQGHMTTMHYVGMFDAAFWHLLSAGGFSQ